MFQCVLIEDEPLAVALFENYIQRVPSLHIIEKIVNQRQLEVWLSKKSICDIVFMDLNIGAGKAFNQILEVKSQCHTLVLTTAYFSEEVKTSKEIDWSGIGLLHKPFTYQSFLTELKRIGCLG